MHTGKTSPVALLRSADPIRPGLIPLPILAGIVVLGCGLYGAAVGWWRAGEMAAYVAVKLPACLLATLAINAILNGILAALAGSGLTFRQTLEAQLHASAVSSLVLAALSPVAAFAALSLPSPPMANLAATHAALMLFHTALIGASGLAGVWHLRRTVQAWAATPKAARLTLLAWVTGNFFVGAQISWILRPFFGSPGLPVAFLRPDPFTSSFYESILKSIARLFGLY